MCDLSKLTAALPIPTPSAASAGGSLLAGQPVQSASSSSAAGMAVLQPKASPVVLQSMPPAASAGGIVCPFVFTSAELAAPVVQGASVFKCTWGAATFRISCPHTYQRPGSVRALLQLPGTNGHNILVPQKKTPLGQITLAALTQHIWIVPTCVGIGSKKAWKASPDFWILEMAAYVQQKYATTVWIQGLSIAGG